MRLRACSALAGSARERGGHCELSVTLAAICAVNVTFKSPRRSRLTFLARPVGAESVRDKDGRGAAGVRDGDDVVVIARVVAAGGGEDRRAVGAEVPADDPVA